MVRKALLALCILAAGLRVQSMPTTASKPVSLPTKITSPTAIWINSSQSLSAASNKSFPSNSILPVTATAQTSPVFTNVSKEPKEEITSTVLNWNVTRTNPSPTNSGVHVTATSFMELTSSLPNASVPATTKSSTLTSPQALVSSPSSLSTTPPEVASASVSTNHSSSTEANTKPTATPTMSKAPATFKAPTTSKAATEEHSSGHTPFTHATTEPVPTVTVPQTTAQTTQTIAQTTQTTLSVVVTCGKIGVEVTSTSPGVIMQEVEHALSSGSIAAITVTVIAVVLLVFGVAAYLKIRHSSYGRLLDDHDYGSWGNYNNPLYDDS
ncbi:prostate androgen-regulated mucin-like protein 1 isoform X1 [Erinaceus europaeus]|uniref:Prostate androgen-regulated mucin-like protein 1 isoform X1 n=1 Tax=Erinaceus europaeus TaxID=9365 RepID=A0ABM3X4T8_ERIEU|nr:prostate androgen-regulated mucin-like protein 1 isoform X1 [Erinaceus europaeus]